MAIDERSRHELYVKLQEVLGPEPATTFMEMTPPVGSDVATTQDVISVREDMAVMRIDLHKDMERLRYELLAAFRGELNTALTSQMKSIVFANTSLFVAFAGLVWSLKVF